MSKKLFVVFNLVATVFSLAAITVPAPAQAGIGSCRTECRFGRCRTRCFGTCAPEAEKGNIAAAVSTLQGIANSADFSSETTFKAKVGEIAAIQDPSEQFGALVELAGVKSDNVAEALGARKISPQQISAIQESTGLSYEHTVKVGEAVQQALLGSLQSE